MGMLRDPRAGWAAPFLFNVKHLRREGRQGSGRLPRTAWDLRLGRSRERGAGKGVG